MATVTKASTETALAWAIELITVSQALSGDAKLKIMAALSPKIQGIDLPAHLQASSATSTRHSTLCGPFGC